MVEGVNNALQLFSQAWEYLIYENKIFAMYITLILMLVVVFFMLRNLTNRD